MPWYIAAWQPERVLAGVSFSGQWPYVPDPDWAPAFPDHAIDSVPGFITQGEYEWVDETNLRGLKIKNAHPLMPLSAMGCPADGHFIALDEKIELLALYMKKAAQYRLPKNNSGGAVKLNSIDVTKNGWLVERYATDKNPSAPAAPAPKLSAVAAVAKAAVEPDRMRVPGANRRAAPGHAARARAARAATPTFFRRDRRAYVKPPRPPRRRRKSCSRPPRR